jgi:hypothetical protein
MNFVVWLRSPTLGGNARDDFFFQVRAVHSIKFRNHTERAFGLHGDANVALD